MTRAARSRVIAVVATLAAGFILAGFVVRPGLSELIFLVAIAVPFVGVGALVAARRPENPIGWLFLAFGLVAAGNFTAGQYALRTLRDDPGALPGGDVAASISAHAWHPAFGLFVYAFLLFPNGQLLSERWRWATRAVFLTYAGLALSAPFDVDFLQEDIPEARPLFHGALVDVGGAVFGVLLIVNVGLLVLAAVSLLLRLRRAHGMERQQVKLFVVTVAFVMLVFPVGLVVVGDGSVGVLLFPLIPVSAGVAILRYRLYDIDLVINRALVYSGLTATLAGAYLGCVLVLQLVLSSLTSDSGLAVAGSTLAVAALFRPARSRIQEAVDHRFYRRRYDARHTVESFSGRLRDQVDLEALSGDLSGVVRDTLQPAHVTLWLRERP